MPDFAPIPEDPSNVKQDDPIEKNRATTFWNLLEPIIESIDADKPKAQRDVIRRFLLRLAWHEGARLTKRVQVRGPARGFPQLEAQKAKDGCEWADTGGVLKTLAEVGAVTESQLRTAYRALSTKPDYPPGNVIEEILRKRDRFGIYVARYALKRIKDGIPASLAEQVDYWFEYWKVKDDDEAGVKKQFRANAEAVDKLILPPAV